MKQPLHKENHLESSSFIADIVIGLSDGLTVPFALAAGVSSAVSDPHIVTTAGIAELIAGGISMGLGGFLAGQTEVDHYRSELKREYWEVDHLPDEEKEEVRKVFESFGLSPKIQQEATEELSKDKAKWVDFMMHYELNLEKPDPNRAKKSAANIGLAYVAGGILPLLPYFFVDTPLYGLKISSVIALICLAVFGYFKSKVTGQPVVSGALKVMFIGAVAAASAFFVAKLFGA